MSTEKKIAILACFAVNQAAWGYLFWDRTRDFRKLDDQFRRLYKFTGIFLEHTRPWDGFDEAMDEFILEDDFNEIVKNYKKQNKKRRKS